MPEGITLKRIIDMDETEQLSSSDYVLVDSSSGGNRKYALGDKLAQMDNDLSHITPTMTTFAEYVDDADFVDDVNLLDGVAWGEAGYMRQPNGTLVTSQYTTSYIASDFIPVVAGYKYRAYADRGFNLYALYYSDSKNDGTNVSLGWVGTGEYVDITVPEGKTFVSFNCAYNASNKLSGLFRLTQYDSEKKVSIPKLVIDSGEFVGKKIANFGDSIFGQARPPHDISTALARLTGATVYNCAFGGCEMGYHSSANYDAFSMYRLADAIASGDWSLQETAAAASGMPVYFPETVSLLKTIDFGKIDILTIAYGTNDFSNGLQPVKPNDPVTGERRFYATGTSLQYSIQTILTAYPNIRIFVCLPTYRVWLTSGNVFDYDSNTATHTSWVGGETQDHTLIDFVEAERTVAKANQIPVIDNYFDLGINQYNWTKYFPAGDGTHHNQNGRNLIAEHIAHCLW